MASKAKEEEWREKAKKELEDWHVHQSEQMEKNKANNRLAAARQHSLWLVLASTHVENSVQLTGSLLYRQILIALSRPHSSGSGPLHTDTAAPKLPLWASFCVDTVTPACHNATMACQLRWPAAIRREPTLATAAFLGLLQAKADDVGANPP